MAVSGIDIGKVSRKPIQTLITKNAAHHEGEAAFKIKLV